MVVQAVVVQAVAADSKNKYEVQKCTSYSFVHTFNEMPFMSDNANIDEDILRRLILYCSAYKVCKVHKIFFGNCSMLMIGDLEVKEIFRNFVAKNKEWRYDEKRIRKSA